MVQESSMTWALWQDRLVVDRALSFGGVAEAYEKYRPGYPDGVLDAVLTFAGRPVASALEIGAGTGKATRLFARRIPRLTAIEPDAQMLAELRRHVPTTVVTSQSTFEDFDSAEPFDLVFAAASMHWTEPEGRWARVAKALRPGGVFAAFGAPLILADPAVADAVQAARAPFLGDEAILAPGLPPDPGPDQLAWPGGEMLACGRFGEVGQSIIRRRMTLPASDYVGLLSTVSAFVVLPAGQRQQLWEVIRGVLPDDVEVIADTLIHLGRRA
jgi:SAM-dependent methyltransferase